MDPEAPTATDGLPHNLASISGDSTTQVIEDARVDPWVEMSVLIESNLDTIDTETILTLESQNSTMEDETYQYLYKRWMTFSDDERAMEKETFTVNGFLPEFHRRRKAYDLKLTQQLRNLLPPPPIDDHITVWQTTPTGVKISYQSIEPSNDETDEKE